MLARVGSLGPHVPVMIRVFGIAISLRNKLGGLPPEHVHPMHTILAGCSLLGCGAKTIEPRRDANLLQADLAQIRNDLCLRQSACDSTGPEIDVTEGVFREL